MTDDGSVEDVHPHRLVDLVDLHRLAVVQAVLVLGKAAFVTVELDQQRITHSVHLGDDFARTEYERGIAAEIVDVAGQGHLSLERQAVQTETPMGEFAPTQRSVYGHEVRPHTACLARIGAGSFTCEPGGMTTTSDDTLAPEHCLGPTWFIDSDNADVAHFARAVCDAAGATSDRDKAVALFLAVRDGWRYDPYDTTREAGDYRASSVLRTTSAWCIPKSVLLTTLCRAEGIPARLGFADVRNHLQSAKLRESMGTDLFIFHGYSEIWIEGAWRKASSAFNKELCERFGTKVLEFDGINDALMHPFDESGNRHMEYVRQRGSYADLPLDEIFSTFDEFYGTSMLGDGSDDDAFAGE
jgi:transglutaminase-like putative cysteine protease